MQQPAFDLRPDTISTITRASAGSADPSSPRTAPTVHFDSGVRLEREDHVRLGAQIARVRSVLADGGWWSVPRLHNAIFFRFDVRDPEPSISAQIRNLKKTKHGGHAIERRRVGNVYEFRLVGE